MVLRGQHNGRYSHSVGLREAVEQIIDLVHRDLRLRHRCPVLEDLVQHAEQRFIEVRVLPFHKTGALASQSHQTRAAGEWSGPSQ